jgi:hypothetical protein
MLLLFSDTKPKFINFAMFDIYIKNKLRGLSPPTEQLPLVGEVNANFFWIEGAA